MKFVLKQLCHGKTISKNNTKNQHKPANRIVFGKSRGILFQCVVVFSCSHSGCQLAADWVEKLAPKFFFFFPNWSLKKELTQTIKPRASKLGENLGLRPQLMHKRAHLRCATSRSKNSIIPWWVSFVVLYLCARKIGTRKSNGYCRVDEFLLQGTLAP